MNTTNEASLFQATWNAMDQVNAELGNMLGGYEYEDPLAIRANKLEKRLIHMPVQTLEGVAVKLRWLLNDMKCLQVDEIYIDATETILDAVEDMTATSTVGPQKTGEAS